jgi:hypothetical protein
MHHPALLTRARLAALRKIGCQAANGLIKLVRDRLQHANITLHHEVQMRTPDAVAGITLTPVALPTTTQRYWR